jgi:trehalose 6-phosphate phosphatase
MNLCLPLKDLLDKSGHENVFLFLDYDGTLAEFAPNPDIVLPDDELIQLLTRLNAHPKVELAVVSGRRLGHIRNLVPVQDIWLAGSYGVEMITPDGNEIDLLSYDELRPRLEEVKPIWEVLVKGRDEFYLEDKGWSIAIHANGENKKEVDAVIEKANEIYVPEGFILQGNDHFVELCPPEAEKGNSIRHILSLVDQEDKTPIFLGDDDRDESAFEAVENLGGVGVLISDQPIESKATSYLKNPKMVRRWLAEFLE